MAGKTYKEKVYNYLSTTTGKDGNSPLYKGSFEDWENKLNTDEGYREKVYNYLSTTTGKDGKSPLYKGTKDEWLNKIGYSTYSDLSLSANIENIKDSTETTTDSLEVKPITMSTTGNIQDVFKANLNDPVAQTKVRAQAIWDNIDKMDDKGNYIYSDDDINNLDDDTYKALVAIANDEENKYIAQKKEKLRANASMRNSGVPLYQQEMALDQMVKQDLVNSPYPKKDRLEKLKRGYGERFEPLVAASVANTKERVNNLGWTTKTEATPWGGGSTQVYVVDKDGKRVSEEQSSYMGHTYDLITETEKLLSAPSIYDASNGFKNFAKGIADATTEAEFWLPFEGLAENMGVAKVAKKLNRNEELTTVEEALLESYINYGLAQEARQFNLSTGYKVGQGSAESIKFMLEMAIGGNITSSAGKAFVNKLAKKSLGKVGKAVVKFANSTSKAANFGKGALSTFVDPMFMASTWVNMSKAYADTHVHGDQDFSFVDMTSSYMDTVKEGATEKIGGILPTPSFLKDMYKFIPSYLKPFNGLMQNPLSEIGEEYMGSLFDIVRSWNPLLNEERQAELSAGAKSMWTWEGLKETSLMVAPLSILFGSANAGKMFKVNRAYSKSKQALLAELSNERYGLSQDDAKKVILKFDEAKTQEEKIKVAEKLHKAMYDSFIRENPTATQQERQMFADNVNKLLMHYANSNALYNQDIDDLSERYNKLSDKQKEKVDEALAKFTEQYVKAKQNEAFAQLEQQEADGAVADEQAEVLLQETIQEADGAVADEQEPSLQAYDNEYGFFVKKKGDAMSVTDKSGHTLQFKDKSIADKEAKRLNGNYNGEYDFEVVQTMDGIVPQFAVVGKKKQPTPPPVAKMYDEKNGYGLTQKGGSINVTDREGKAIQFTDRATADKEVKRLNENYKGDLVFEVRQTMDGVLPKFTVVGSKKQQLPESTQLYDEKNGYHLTSNGDVMRVTDEKGRNFKFVDKSVAEREVKRLNNNFNGKYTFEIKQTMNGMIPQFTVIGRKKTAAATPAKPKSEGASKTTTTPKVEETKDEESNVSTGESRPEGEEIRRNPLVYYRGKQHELLSHTTEDGSIIVEDNLVRIREVGKGKTKAVRPENVYNDASYSEVAKTYPPKSNAEKARKVNPLDYKNIDVNANDVADAFLREYGVEDTIEALQEMYSEALEKTQSAKGLTKADAKKELRRLEEVANAISEKTNVVVNLQNNTVEEVVEDTENIVEENVQTNEENTTEEVVEEPQMDVSEVVVDGNPVEVTEIQSETTEEVPTNEESTNEAPATEETVVTEQEPTVTTKVTEQTTTPVEEQRKRRTKSEKGIELDDFISNVNITYKGEKTTLDKFLADVLYDSTINLSDKVMREVDSVLSNLNEETSYEEAYEICSNIENILAKYGLKLSKANQILLYNNIYGPCENADVTIKQKFPRPATEELSAIGKKAGKDKNKDTDERITLEGEAPTQEYVDSLNPEDFDNVLIFESQNSKLGISRRGYPVHMVNDRYFVLIDQTGKKQLIDRNQLGDKDYKKEGIKGTIVYLKGEDGNADLTKPYLAQTEDGSIKYGSVNIYPLFENDTKKIKNQSVDNLFVKTENGVDYYSQSDKQSKEDKVKKAIESFNKEEGSPIDKFISFVDRYIQAFDEKRQAAVAKLGSYDTEFTGVGNFQSLEADSDLIATINDYIDRINGIAKEHGFIEIKHLPNMLGEKIDYHLNLLEFYSKHPTDKEAIKEYIINKNKLNDIKNTPEFKNKSTEEQLKYVEKVIDKVNNELGLFGIDKIKKSENKVVKALKKIASKTKGKKAETKKEQTEQAEATQSNVSNEDSIMSEQEYINYLMEKRGFDEETARSVYEWRKEQGTLGDMREMLDTNKYWYQEEARRFSDMMNLLMGGNKPLQLVSAKTIDRMLAYNRPVAVTSKNIDILKEWIGGLDIELVKPTDKGRASVDGSFGWYDISRKKAVIVEGAPIDVVIHEIGWHATFDWARKHNKKMYDQMVDYATNAPLEVKEYVQGEYGELSEDEFIDEVGAKMFTDMARGNIYQKLRSQEARTWCEKVANLFKELWNKAMLKIFRKPIKDKAIDFEKMKGMEPTDAMSYIAQQMIDGKVLGEFDDYELESSNESVIRRMRSGDQSYTPEMEDIKAKTIADGTFMKAPNGKPSNLNERQWLHVRTKAFKEWFGDWLKTARIEKLRESEPIVVEFNNEYELNRDGAKQWMKDNLRGEYINKDTGEKISLSKRGMDKVTSHGEREIEHIKSIVAIPELIENSIFIEEQQNEKGNEKYDSYKYYVCGLKIDGIDYTAKIVVGVKNGIRYYDHQLTQIEKGTLIDSLNMIAKHVAENQNTLSEYKDTKLISILQTNSSKVVDANGEPKVVCHGSSWNPLAEEDGKAVFSKTDIKDGGHFFTDKKEMAESYKGGIITEVFLNIRNPKEVKVNNFWNKINANKFNIEEIKDVTIYKSRGGGFFIGYIQNGEQKHTNFLPDNLSEQFGNETLKYIEDFLASDNKEIKLETFQLKVPRASNTRELVADAKQEGRDGVIFNNILDYGGNVKAFGEDMVKHILGGGVDNTVYVAFEPTQIKSATDNIGTFDGNNPDIRYMRASNGSIYGINTGYGVFVNIKPETKIGDCADLWLEQLRERNPNAYNLLFKLGKKNNHLSDDEILMSLLRIKLQNWGHKDVSSISDSDLRNMTFEELMDIMPSLEEIGSMDAVQESLDKTYEMLHAQNVLFGGKFEEFWAQAMDDGLPLQRMMEALNAWRMTQGLDPLSDEYDVVNLRNYAASKSRTAIKEFRLGAEATALTDALKKFRNAIENSDELKALMERTVVVKDVNWALRGLKKYKEREMQQLIESYLLAKDLQERRDMGLPTRGIEAFKKEHTMSIDEFVAEFEKNFTDKEIEDLWKKIKDVTKISLDYATKYGIITQELKYTYLERDYYVPQRGFADQDLEDQIRNQRTTSKGKAKIAQKAEGGKTLASDPLAHIFEVTDDTIKKAYRNEYLHKIHELLSMEENKGFFGKAAVSGVYVIENTKNSNGEIVKSMIPIDNMDEEFVKEDEQTREAIKLAQEELKKMSKVLAAGSPTLQALEQTIETLENSIHYERSGAFISDKGKQNGNVVSFFYNGHYVQLEFADQRIADCLNDVHQHSKFQFEKIRKLNAYLSRIYTTYNPVFGFRNVFRDFQQISAIGGSKYGPKFVAGLQKNIISGLPDFVDIARYIEMPFTDFKEMSPEFIEFMRSGAMTGFVYSNTIDDYKDQVRKAISDENSTTFNEICDGAVKSLGFITEAGEIFMRYQAFKTAKQMGMNTHKATEVAKNCGVNFDKKGAGFKEGVFGGLINYVYDNISFSRAQMRGIAPMYEIMGIDKSKAQRKRLLTVLGTYVMIGFTSGLIQGFGDDEDETRNKAIRDEIPRELAQSNLFYKFEWSFEKANDFLNWILPNSIPISQNFIPFYGLGYSLSQIALNHWREFENKQKGPEEKKYAVIDHDIMYQRMAMDFGVNAWMYLCPLPSAITDAVKWGASAIGTAAKAEDLEQAGREVIMTASSLMPTAVAPLFQALNNVDHLGRDIAHMPKFKNKSEYSDFYALRDLAAYLDGGHQEKHFFEDDKINPSKNYEYFLVFTKHLIDGYLPSFVGQGIEFADKYIGENYLGYVPDESTPKEKYNKIVGITARNAVNDFIEGYDNAMRELTNTKSARDYTPNMNSVIEKEARLETMKPAVTLAKQVIEELNKYDVEKKKQGKEFIKDYRKVTLQDYPEQIADEGMYKVYTELLKTTYFMLLEQGYVEPEK